jgi:uncharacterized sulfatase
VQSEGWKLIADPKQQQQWLFDLNTDPTEKKNLARTRPDKLAQLDKLLQAHHAPMPKALWPSFIQMPIMIDKTLNQKEAPGDEVTFWEN